MCIRNALINDKKDAFTKITLAEIRYKITQGFIARVEQVFRENHLITEGYLKLLL
jgi:hypothetical protein